MKAGVLGSLAVAAGGLPGRAGAAATKPERDWVHGLKLGIASYSLRKFPLEEAIKLTRQAGVKYICLKDVHLSMKSSAAELREAGVRMVLYPLSAFRAMAAAAERVYAVIREQGTQSSVVQGMQSRARLYEILNYHQYEQAIDRLLAKEGKSHGEK